MLQRVFENLFRLQELPAQHQEGADAQPRELNGRLGRRFQSTHVREESGLFQIGQQPEDRVAARDLLAEAGQDVGVGLHEVEALAERLPVGEQLAAILVAEQREEGRDVGHAVA
jgi:hypothetical protein